MKLSLEQVLKKYQNNVYRASFAIVRNREDAEDITQNTFLAYYGEKKDFESEEHIRAWLLKVAVNKSNNLAISFWKRNRLHVDDFSEWLSINAPGKEFEPEDTSLLQEVLKLPKQCRSVIHLFYYEEYQIREIAEILGIRENTVKSQLHRGRQLLKERLQEEWDYDEP